MTKVADKLAFALSSADTVSHAQYKRVFDRLYITDAVAAGIQLDDVDRHRRDSARNLEALGICDFLYEEHAVRACIPYFARLPGPGLPAAVLAGARTPGMLLRLRTVARQQRATVALSSYPQPAFPLLPNRVSVLASGEAQLAQFAADTELPIGARPAADGVLAHAASVDEYLRRLEWRTAVEPNWLRADFDPSAMRFGRILATSTRLTCYTHPQRSYKRQHFLFNDGDMAPLDRDWGRYCALARAQAHVLQYDVAQAAFFVPVTVPLPRIYARALTLCSGFAPQQVTNDGLWHVYVRVPLDYAERTAAKLRQELILIEHPGVLRGAHD